MAFIRNHQFNSEGKEQFGIMPIKNALIKFVKGKSYNYHLYFLTSSYDSKVFYKAFNSIKEAESSAAVIMTSNWIMDEEKPMNY